MGLEEVKDSILESASQQAEVLLDQATKDASAVEDDAKQSIKELENKAQKELETAEKNLEKLKLSSAESEAKHILLETKKKIINEAFDAAKQQVLEQKKDYLSSLLSKAQKELDIKHVYCNKSDIKTISGFEASASEISGGLIVENGQQTVRLDYSYDTIFDTLKSKILQDVAAKLFK
jgi:vacuolar-type H+-ATPase subunit E/Vma4